MKKKKKKKHHRLFLKNKIHIVDTERKAIITVDEDEEGRARILLSEIKKRWGKRGRGGAPSELTKITNRMKGAAEDRGITLNKSELQDKVERWFFAWITNDIVAAQEIVEGIQSEARPEER